MELERLGKYELLARLGQGGMGEVWKARDTQLRRYVAIKLLHADLQANPDFVTHFMREAQFVASLRHPNIVQIHDFQLTGTQGSNVKAYMVMDYIEGGTLAEYINNTVRKSLFPPAADIVYLFTAISLALDYAHQKGMIHRDIKPANILLDSSAPSGRATGEPILTDFGIARLQGASAGGSTVTRALIGTPRYISPEQAEGHAIDERSDLYSLGIVLYEILTGITPFRGDNPIAVMMQHIHETPPPPDLINPKVTAALSAVVLQSIAKDPEARFPSATAMTVALAGAFGLPVPASLNKPGNINEQPDYNPLQPYPLLPGMVHPPFPAATAQAALFTPASTETREPQSNSPVITPARLTPARSDHGEKGLQSLLPAYRRRKSLYIALIAFVVLLLVGAGAISVFSQLFSKNVTQVTPTPNTSNQVIVGHIIFLSSPNTPHNTFDQLQIDLNNIPSPPAGKTYYAWLEISSSDSIEYPNWQLQVANGSVHGLYSSSVQHADLYARSDTFLITTEDSSSTPIIPFTDLSRHLYYAIISHTSSSSPTFEVRHCPSSSSGNAGNPCA